MASFHYKYNEHGIRIEEFYFCIDGELCLSTYGYAKRIFEYEERGWCISVYYYDKEENFIIGKYFIKKIKLCFMMEKKSV